MNTTHDDASASSNIIAFEPHHTRKLAEGMAHITAEFFAKWGIHRPLSEVTEFFRMVLSDEHPRYEDVMRQLEAHRGA